MSGITTHVLDTSRGRPAEGLAITLERLDASGVAQRIGGGTTDAAGRSGSLLPDGAAAAPGTYRLTFETAAWYARTGADSLYPRVVVEFEVREPASSYHLPLLLSPYGYSTYRGS